MTNINSTDQKNVFQDLARAAWIAPLLGLLISLLLAAAHLPIESKVYRLPNAIVLFGLICALLSLIGIVKHGPRGIVAPALGGLVLLATVFSASLYFARLAREQIATQIANLNRTTQSGLQEFLNTPGWFGAISVFGGRFTVVSVDDQSAMGQEFNTHTARKVSLVGLSFDNVSGTNACNINPNKIRLQLANGTQVDGLSADNIFAESMVDRDKYLARFGGNIIVPSGGTSLDRIGFFPAGTDFAQAQSLSIEINGQTISIKGRYLTPDEKRSKLIQPPPAGK